MRKSIDCEADIVTVRMRGCELARKFGFSSSDAVLVATLVSELARNILLYAKRGEITLGILVDGARQGIEIVARDQGPGIPDIGQALRDGYSTSGGLGLGLSGVRRLTDDFKIVSEAGDGTIVTARKWKEVTAGARNQNERKWCGS